MEFDSTAPDFTSRNVKWELRPGWGDVLEARCRHISTDGDLVLVAAGDSPSKGRVGIYQRKSKKLLWSAAVTNYPHSIERVPGVGAVIVAGAGTARPGEGKPRPNGSLHLYGPKDKHIASLGYIGSYPLQEAHGVLWDPQYELLWAIGRTEVRRYRVKGTYRGMRLEEVDAAHRIRIGGNGHDIQPDYTDKHRLLLTDSNHVYALDKRTLKVQALPGALGNKRHVKSIARHASGQYMWAGVPDGVDSAFGGPAVHFESPGATRNLDKGGVTYKARIATNSYQ
ncbi:hypothetical protein E4099_15030 [Streptomyces palmae]|uniref:WD40 repeat domain-containing protein n=2 Tax=Streptomyces palmae TaxID=1701085 RepID=A0A4Z0H852_9ACTN|nr:hypothetical protein E4099_15030 [Streptomyces palmae]